MMPMNPDVLQAEQLNVAFAPSITVILVGATLTSGFMQLCTSVRQVVHENDICTYMASQSYCFSS